MAIEIQSVALTGATGTAIYAMAETVGVTLHAEPPQVALGLCLMAAVAMSPNGWWRSGRQWIFMVFAALSLMVTALGVNGADQKLQRGEVLLVPAAVAQSNPTPPPTPIIWEPRRPW